jgi:hypothetical protein
VAHYLLNYSEKGSTYEETKQPSAFLHIFIVVLLKRAS